MTYVSSPAFGSMNTGNIFRLPPLKMKGEKLHEREKWNRSFEV
jgi:hypothetical protein